VLKLATAFAVLCCASAASAQSFSCSLGRKPACLGYDDKVVDQNAQCFDSMTCFPGGFVCKSDVERAQEKARQIITGYDEFRNCVARSNDMSDVESCIRADSLKIY